MDNSRSKLRRSQSRSPNNEYVLTKDDFQLVNYIYPDRFFKHYPRPLRVIDSLPGVGEFDDVIYKPTTSWSQPYDGCLYDNKLRRIDTSCIWQNRTDDCMSTEPLYMHEPPEKLPTYDRPVIYLGYVNWHYGHFLLESLSKWWILAKRYSDIDRFLIHVHDPNVLDLPFIQICLSLAGISREQIVLFDKPVKFTQVVVPESSVQLLSHMYTEYRMYLNKLMDSMDIGIANRTSQPLYVSRTRLDNGYIRYQGEVEIEQYLIRNGARVIHPQELSFVEQVKLFNEHSVIIGIAGSGMHNVVLTQLPKTLVYLTPSWVNVDNFIIDKCFNANSTYIQACTISSQLNIYWNRLLLRTKLKREKVTDGFLMVQNLDYERVINWFREFNYF